MPRFGKDNFHQFLLGVSKMNENINFKDNFYVLFWWLSNQNVPFKVCNNDFIRPGFDNQFIFKNLYLVA